MTTQTAENLDSLVEDFYEDGFALLPGYMTGTPEITNLQRAIYDTVAARAESCGLPTPENNFEDINRTCIELARLWDKNIAWVSDVINMAPEVTALYRSPRIHHLIKKFMRNDSPLLITNGQGVRVQVPGRDAISNLPWHQDSHYHKSYVRHGAVVCWISISDIENEAGPVVFKKGSTALGQVKQERIENPWGRTIIQVEEKYLNDPRFPEVSYPTKPGDVVLIEFDVIHRSGNNASKDKVKWSTQGRFFNARLPGFLSCYDKPAE